MNTFQCQQLLDESTLYAVADNLGSAVALSTDGNTLIAGTYNGAVLFAPQGDRWDEVAHLEHKVMSAGEGVSSVAINKTGTVAVVGHSDSGTVCIWGIVSGQWVNTETLVSNRGVNSLYGVTVALSDDGLTLAVGDNGSVSGSGIYLYHRQHNGWKLITVIGSELKGVGEVFCLSKLGEKIIYSYETPLDVGGVELYQREHNEWSFVRTLLPAISQPHMGFGASLAMSYTGETIAIAASGQGRIHVFTDFGLEYLCQVNTRKTRVIYHHPIVITLSDDGQLIFTTVNTGDSQQVFVYERQGKRIHHRQTLLHPVETDEFYGRSLSYSAASGLLAIGSFTPYHNLEEGEGVLYFWRH